MINLNAIIVSDLKHNVDLCGPETDIKLKELGEMSSVTINLASQEKRSLCRLRVSAPKTHAINVQVIDNNIESNRHSTEMKNNQEQCLLNVVSTRQN